MNQGSQFQQSQDFKCKDHPENLFFFGENQIFSLNCQKQNIHAQHENEDVLSIQELHQFLIEKSKLSKGHISECQIQFQSTIKSYENLMFGLSQKFCGLEGKISKLNFIKHKKHLILLISFYEFKNHLNTNFQDCYTNQKKFR
ncbi:unnamed protein product [Paramecium octaurelia]|uniref:Uncharacterized protein n=1 Tax=Paramecium octaurelia TaxID=43137 RepID=A0A8S1YR93_PAROT|nr:unnamed protein product [Paramecium octaurelia]